MGACGFSHTDGGGGAKIVHPLKGVCKKDLPCLERGTAKHV